MLLIVTFQITLRGTEFKFREVNITKTDDVILTSSRTITVNKVFIESVF